MGYEFVFGIERPSRTGTGIHRIAWDRVCSVTDKGYCLFVPSKLILSIDVKWCCSAQCNAYGPWPDTRMVSVDGGAAGPDCSLNLDGNC